MNIDGVACTKDYKQLCRFIHSQCSENLMVYTNIYVELTLVVTNIIDFYFIYITICFVQAFSKIIVVALIVLL